MVATGSFRKRAPKASSARAKPRRWRRSVVSTDESLVAASARPAMHMAAQPLVRALAVPLCAPTMVAPPVGGKPFLERLDPQDVMACGVVESSLVAVLLGFAQMRPTGVKKVALTRPPTLDVVVRLYNESGNGLLYPMWVLARSHRAGKQQQMQDETTVAEEGGARKTVGTAFCQHVFTALAPSFKLLNGKPMLTRMAALTRSITGRNLGQLGIEDRERAWENMLNAICDRRPVFAVTKETNPQHNKNRRFAPNAPLVVLEAFELRGERYVCVYDAEGANEGFGSAPKDVTFDEYMREISQMVSVV